MGGSTSLTEVQNRSCSSNSGMPSPLNSIVSCLRDCLRSPSPNLVIEDLGVISVGFHSGWSAVCSSCHGSKSILGKGWSWEVLLRILKKDGVLGLYTATLTTPLVRWWCWVKWWWWWRGAMAMNFVGWSGGGGEGRWLWMVLGEVVVVPGGDGGGGGGGVVKWWCGEGNF